MKLYSGSSLRRCGFFLGVVLFCALGPSDLYSSTQIDEKQRYLFRVSNTNAASQLIRAVGGNVFDTIESLNYLGAELTDDQLKLVSRSVFIVSISPSAESASYDSDAGGLAEFGAEVGEELVAGNIWDRKI